MNVTGSFSSQAERNHLAEYGQVRGKPPPLAEVFPGYLRSA